MATEGPTRGRVRHIQHKLTIHCYCRGTAHGTAWYVYTFAFGFYVQSALSIQCTTTTNEPPLHVLPRGRRKEQNEAHNLSE